MLMGDGSTTLQPSTFVVILSSSSSWNPISESDPSMALTPQLSACVVDPLCPPTDSLFCSLVALVVLALYCIIVHGTFCLVSKGR
jgi:glutamine synthetase